MRDPLGREEEGSPALVLILDQADVLWERGLLDYLLLRAVKS